jgi:hypothetical protein
MPTSFWARFRGFVNQSLTQDTSKEPQMFFEDSVGALESGRQEQQFLLNLGRQLSHFMIWLKRGRLTCPTSASSR